MRRELSFASLAAVATVSLASMTNAATLDGVGTFEGVAGIGAPNGDVAAPPVGKNYVYVTTAGSTYLDAGLDVGDETNGSELTTNTFAANTGGVLEYFFNYITSDGTSSFVEYAYALLNNVTAGTSQLIFTARTTPSGDTVPGFGLPPIAAGVVLDPLSTPVIPGGVEWDELGVDSGECFNIAGCGQTGWIKSTLTVADEGTYSLTFGVVNWGDRDFDSGLAIAGLTIDGDVIVDPDDPSPIPLPAGGLLLLGALGAMGMVRRKARG